VTSVKGLDRSFTEDMRLLRWVCSQSHRTMSDVHKRHARHCKLTAHPKKHTAAAADRVYRLSWLERPLPVPVPTSPMSRAALLTGGPFAVFVFQSRLPHSAHTGALRRPGACGPEGDAGRRLLMAISPFGSMCSGCVVLLVCNAKLPGKLVLSRAPFWGRLEAY
jgi:hypothetical protein